MSVALPGSSSYIEMFYINTSNKFATIAMYRFGKKSIIIWKSSGHYDLCKLYHSIFIVKFIDLTPTCCCGAELSILEGVQ